MTSGAVTWLFVPGNMPHRFARATSAGAGAVVLDLEDAVRAEDKERARHETVEWLNGDARAWVRINGHGTNWYEDDLDALHDLEGLLGVIVPKAEDPVTLAAVIDRLPEHADAIALVETALGVHRAFDIASVPGITRLAFGSVDLATDLRVDEEDDALLMARSTVVLASRAARIAAPIDGVSMEMYDVDVIEKAARRSRSLGFRGKLCIHPAQVAPTAQALAYSSSEVGWAHEVLATAAGSTGAVAGPRGQMIDKPVVERARAILRGTSLDGCEEGAG